MIATVIAYELVKKYACSLKEITRKSSVDAHDNIIVCITIFGINQENFVFSW